MAQERKTIYLGDLDDKVKCCKNISECHKTKLYKSASATGQYYIISYNCPRCGNYEVKAQNTRPKFSFI